MKKRIRYYLLFGIMPVFWGCFHFSGKKTNLVPEDKRIILQWNKAYENDSLQLAVKGLEWAMSNVGARTTQLIHTIATDDGKINLNVAKLGFDKVTVENLMILHHNLKATDEYEQIGAIDLGRYITLILGAPKHYYKLVQLPVNYFDLLSQYRLTDSKGHVNNSSVSKQNRIILFSEQEKLKQLFVSEETDKETGQILEYETIDIMSNGQLRFGIFDKSGKPKNSASPDATKAGKPAKCMWCHESRIQPLFKDQLEVKGYLPAAKLGDTLEYFRKSHVEDQNALTLGVDYTKSQDHAFMELLYISFMEPSAERLSLEWRISTEEVVKKLSKLEKHMHPEFGEILGLVYHRADVDPYAPFKSLPVSSDVREKSMLEVNYMD